MATQSYEELIIKGIRDLPPEVLAEIADFVYFVRRRVMDPEGFAEDVYTALLRRELKQLSRDEQRHLEEEFAEYERRYPCE